jgi:hypothetical protein
MVYQTAYPWYFEPPYPWYIDPPTHGILTPYPWYSGPVKPIMDRSIMAFFKKNEDYLKISKIS